MGTRADFYVRIESKEPKMEWLGSIAWDGYSIDGVENATTEQEFRDLLTSFLKGRNDSTYPENGWPWPWKNSKLTDEVWVWSCEDNSIYRGHDYDGDHNDATTNMYFSKGVEQFGFDKDGEKIENIDRSNLKAWLVPDMSHLQNVARGKRSGLIVISADKGGSMNIE